MSKRYTGGEENNTVSDPRRCPGFSQSSGGSDIIWVPPFGQVCSEHLLVVGWQRPTVDPRVPVGGGGRKAMVVKFACSCSPIFQSPVVGKQLLLDFFFLLKTFLLRHPKGNDGQNSPFPHYFACQLGLISKTPILVHWVLAPDFTRQELNTVLEL